MKEKSNRNRFWSWRRRPKNPPPEADKTAPQPADPDDLEKLDALGISGNANDLVDNIHRHIIDVGNRYFHLGRIHGRESARNFQMFETAKMHATLITDRVISTVNGNIDKLELATSKHTDELQGQEAYNTWCLEEHQEQMKLKMNDSRQFSRFNAWFAFIAGILIILADIAISLNLVAFFGIGHIKPKAPFLDKVKDIELMLFSLGIALCTVYIKIFFDEYIGGKFAYVQQHFNSLTKDKKVSRSSIRAEFWIKFSFKLLILFGLIFMLYNLALYRTYFTVYGKELTAIKGIAANGGPTLEGMTGMLLKSFIGITILLPVISGIAISVCLKILSNRRMLNVAARNQDEAEKRYNTCKEVLLNETFNLAQLRNYFAEWEKRIEKINVLSAYFTHQYNQGYKVGYFRAHGNDFYHLVEIARNEEINQLFTKKQPETNHENPQV